VGCEVTGFDLSVLTLKFDTFLALTVIFLGNDVTQRSVPEISDLSNLACPTEKLIKEVKRIFRYLRQTINMGQWYSKDSGFELIAYLDADHAGCNHDCKRISGGIQFLGDKLVSWSSKKQDCTTMSTAEAE
ncbi:hypothetical protein Tco_1398252, partial [Tanacetum coccineum]